MITTVLFLIDGLIGGSLSKKPTFIQLNQSLRQIERGMLNAHDAHHTAPYQRGNYVLSVFSSHVRLPPSHTRTGSILAEA